MNIYRIACLVLLLTITGDTQKLGQRLELRAEIKRQRYCEIDDKVGVLWIGFKMSLINRGTSTTSFYPPDHPLTLVSRTLNSLHRGEHEFEIHAPDAFVDPREPSHENSSPEKSVVRPGAVFEWETKEISLPAPKTAKYKKWEALSPGIHYVQLVVESESEGATGSLRTKSQPVEITIEKNPRTEKCQ